MTRKELKKANRKKIERKARKYLKKRGLFGKKT